MKGFYLMIEVFLALFILFSGLSAIMMFNTPKDYDAFNTPRLEDVAKRIALSYKAQRPALLQNSLEDIDKNLIPTGVGHRVLLYSNGTGQTLDVLVNSTGDVPKNSSGIFTYSTLISGYIKNETEYYYAPRRLVVQVWQE